MLAQTEVGELHEPAAAGRGTSSTMPHKRNPVLSQQIIVATRIVRANVTSMLEVMVQDHERGSATWQAEWTLIPNLTSHAFCALERTQELLAGLKVNPARMIENLRQSGEFIYAEAVMMALAPMLGRLQAHDLVEKAVGHAEQGRFIDALLQLPEIAEVLSEKKLRELFTGEVSISASSVAVDAILRY